MIWKKVFNAHAVEQTCVSVVDLTFCIVIKILVQFERMDSLRRLPCILRSLGCLKSHVNNISSRQLSSGIIDTTSPLSSFRTSETDASKHSLKHEGRIYRIPDDVYEGIFQLGGFRDFHQNMFKLFKERCIMVRRPALEVIDYLKRTDFSRPVNRYIFCKTLDYVTALLLKY